LHCSLAARHRPDRDVVPLLQQGTVCFWAIFGPSDRRWTGRSCATSQRQNANQTVDVRCLCYSTGIFTVICLLFSIIRLWCAVPCLSKGTESMSAKPPAPPTHPAPSYSTQLSNLEMELCHGQPTCSYLDCAAKGSSSTHSPQLIIFLPPLIPIS
jgi:hypothetical protein